MTLFPIFINRFSRITLTSLGPRCINAKNDRLVYYFLFIFLAAISFENDVCMTFDLRQQKSSQRDATVYWYSTDEKLSPLYMEFPSYKVTRLSNSHCTFKQQLIENEWTCQLN